MTDETISPNPRPAVDDAVREKRREARRLREEIQTLRNQAREISVKRKELEGKYAALAAEAGLPERGKRDQPRKRDGKVASEE